MDFLAANPIVLVIAAVAALVMGLIYAYQNCAPFRNAINEIGAALGGAILTAARDISGALNFLWNNVLVPIANFLEKVFVAAINDATGAIKPFETAIKDVTSIGSDLEKGIGAISGALSHLCFVHATPAAEEFNKTLKDSIGLTDTLTGKVGGLSTGLTGVSGAVGVGGAGGISSGIAAAASKPTAPVINITAPLVQIQGSADKKTAELAAQLVQNNLKSVLIEPTSPSSGSHRRIRTGWQGV
jgi:hypothetical protein